MFKGLYVCVSLRVGGSVDREGGTIGLPQAASQLQLAAALRVTIS